MDEKYRPSAKETIPGGTAVLRVQSSPKISGIHANQTSKITSAEVHSDYLPVVLPVPALSAYAQLLFGYCENHSAAPVETPDIPMEICTKKMAQSPDTYSNQSFILCNYAV